MATPAKTERFELRLDPGILEDVDAWRSRQADIPSRAEAMRRLVEAGLGTPKEREIGFSDGEKLVTLMLCEIYKHLKMKSEIDPSFVEATIHQGHLWALGWEYTGILHSHESNTTTRVEVINILDMWSFIERGYGKLSKKDKVRVETEADPFGKRVTFSGFDGNYETGHLGIAGFLINNLNRFSEFKGRDLNSHSPSLDAYRRMLKVFEPVRHNLIGQELDASQIIDILSMRGHPKASKG
jgi:uncharacterized protein YfbU (UPF0304 family)